MGTTVFSTKIRKLRKEAGYTQDKVSRMLNIQRQTYSNYEMHCACHRLRPLLRSPVFITSLWILCFWIRCRPYPLTEVRFLLRNGISCSVVIRICPNQSEKRFLNLLSSKSSFPTEFSSVCTLFVYIIPILFF